MWLILRKQIRFMGLVGGILILLLPFGMITATHRYHPTSNPKVEAATHDFPDSGQYWKAWNFQINNNPWPRRMDIESRVWGVSDMTDGYDCFDRANAICNDGSCSGPGRDIWVYGNLPGFNNAWITTRHQYRLSAGSTLTKFFTAAIYTHYQSASWFKGEGTAAEAILECPPSNNISR